MQRRRRGQGGDTGASEIPQTPLRTPPPQSAPPVQGASSLPPYPPSGAQPIRPQAQPFPQTQNPFATGAQPALGAQNPFANGSQSVPQAQNPFASAAQPAQQRPPAAAQAAPFQGAGRPWLRVALIVLVLANIAAAALILVFNGLTLASQKAKLAEQERIINNHPLYFRGDIERTAARYNLQAAYVAAIIKNESSFRTDARSNAGALGLMQLMPDTAEWIAGKLKDNSYTFERLADGKLNMEYGCWYLNFLSKRFWSDPILTTAAYHTGQGKVANWLSDKKISPDGRRIPLENMPDGPTKQYVRRVLDSYAIYEALYFSAP